MQFFRRRQRIRPGQGRGPVRWTVWEIMLVVLSVAMIVFPLSIEIVQWVNPSLAPAQVAEPQQRVTDTPAPPTATLSGSETPTATATETSSVPTSTPTAINTPSNSSGLTLVKASPLGQAAPGDLVSFTISAKADTAMDITLVDTIDPNLESIQASTNSGSCNVSGQTVSCSLSLSVGSAASVNIQARINASTANNTSISNIASATGGGETAFSNSVSIRVNANLPTDTPGAETPTFTPSPTQVPPTTTPTPTSGGGDPTATPTSGGGDPTATPTSSSAYPSPTTDTPTSEPATDTPIPTNTPVPQPTSTPVPSGGGGGGGGGGSSSSGGGGGSSRSSSKKEVTPPVPPPPPPTEGAVVPAPPPPPPPAPPTLPPAPVVVEQPVAPVVVPTSPPPAATNTPVPEPTNTPVPTKKPTPIPTPSDTGVSLRIMSDWGSAFPGQDVVYTLVLQNNRPATDDGGGVLQNVLVESTLPSNLKVNGATADRGNDPSVSGNDVQLKLASLKPGEAVEVRVDTTIKSRVDIGTILVAQGQANYDTLGFPLLSNIATVNVVGEPQQQAMAATAYPYPSPDASPSPDSSPSVATSTPTSTATQSSQAAIGYPTPTATRQSQRNTVRTNPDGTLIPLPATSTGIPIAGFALLGLTLLIRTVRLHRVRERI